MRTINFTKKYKRDYKRAKRGLYSKNIDKELSDVFHLLIQDLKLPNNRYDHSLEGEWKDHRDCHIKPDLILIYKKTENNTLLLVRLGSHSELGL